MCKCTKDYIEEFKNTVNEVINVDIIMERLNNIIKKIYNKIIRIVTNENK